MHGIRYLDLFSTSISTGAAFMPRYYLKIKGYGYGQRLWPRLSMQCSVMGLYMLYISYTCRSHLALQSLTALYIPGACTINGGDCLDCTDESSRQLQYSGNTSDKPYSYDISNDLATCRRQRNNNNQPLYNIYMIVQIAQNLFVRNRTNSHCRPVVCHFSLSMSLNQYH